MRLRVDEDCCAGHGACVETCPSVFAIGAGGYAEVLVDEVPTELEGRARQAVDECPSGAILIVAEPG